MSIITSGFHPSFDALSACADQSDLDAARTRTGRHVAKCASCAAVVTEVRALGDAARAAELPGAPEGLWARIEREASAQPPVGARLTPAPEDVEVWRPAPALRPTVHAAPSRRLRRTHIALGALAAAVVLFGVLIVMPGRSPLFATAPSRITFTPFRPAPGSRVQVRYRPTPKMAKYDRLILAGSYLDSTSKPTIGFIDYYGGGLYDSLTTLHRAPDGDMIGEFTVPSNFRAVWLIVADPTGAINEADGWYSWFLVGGDERGRPSLSTLLSTLDFTGYSDVSRAQILDTLQRYFPDHPAGFATARRYVGHRIFGDLIEFFTGAERKYASFDAKLEKLPALDAGRIKAMIAFADNIEEPGEAAKWTDRLVREHPDDPQVVGYYAAMLHQMELRSAPADSIRLLVRKLDSLGMRLPLNAHVPEAQAFVSGYGTEDMQRRWALMRARGLRFRTAMVESVDDRWLTDPEIRSLVLNNLHHTANVSCSIPPGRVARQRWNFGWQANCTRARVLAFEELSRLSLLERKPVAARNFADSSVAIGVADDACFGRFGYRRLGSALLATGDTLGAARAFAKSMWYDDGRETAHRDSIRRIVAPVMDSAHFWSLIRSAEQEGRTCNATWNARRKAAEGR